MFSPSTYTQIVQWHSFPLSFAYVSSPAIISLTEFLPLRLSGQNWVREFYCLNATLLSRKILDFGTPAFYFSELLLNITNPMVQTGLPLCVFELVPA